MPDIFLQFLLFFGLSTLISGVFLWGLKKIFVRFDLLDKPHLYAMEKGRKPVPYGIGILILMVLLVISPFLYLYGDFSPLLEKRLFYVIVIGAVMALISFVDDMDTIGKSHIKVPPIFRLGMQILVGAFIGLTSIKISYVSHIFGGILQLDEIYWNIHLF